MIGFIKGALVDNSEGAILLENNGIGYEIAVSNTTLAHISGKGEVKLFTYLNVREDGLYLYGFATKEEKNMFLKLISISGVGPKVALGILSGIELNNLIIAIISSDTKTLSKIKGIGKKTAERIVLELRESLDVDNNLLFEGGNEDIIDTLDKDTMDAISALRSLGIGQKEAVDAVKKARAKASNIEELISIALRSLN
ncbi:Holliday junction branch migration protein RuvA [bacterium]|nr:Holliday junction branch migration protein RuvA [bacterium]